MVAEHAREIPTEMVLRIVEAIGVLRWPKNQPREFRWAFVWDIEDSLRLNGIEAPPKVLDAKLRKMVKKGLIDGCTCGCRGDFYVKDENVLPLEPINVLLKYGS